MCKIYCLFRLKYKCNHFRIGIKDKFSCFMMVLNHRSAVLKHLTMSFIPIILNNCQYLGLYLVLKTFIHLLNVYKRLQCLLGEDQIGHF